jgi:hypothetical protein
MCVLNYARMKQHLVRHLVLPCPFLPSAALSDVALKVEVILGIPVQHKQCLSQHIELNNGSTMSSLVERVP